MAGSPTTLPTGLTLFCCPGEAKFCNFLAGTKEGSRPEGPKYRISTTQGNSRITKRSSSEGPVLTVKQKLEASLLWTPASKDTWMKINSVSHYVTLLLPWLIFPLFLFLFSEILFDRGCKCIGSVCRDGKWMGWSCTKWKTQRTNEESYKRKENLFLKHSSRVLKISPCSSLCSLFYMPFIETLIECKMTSLGPACNQFRPGNCHCGSHPSGSL